MIRLSYLLFFNFFIIWLEWLWWNDDGMISNKKIEIMPLRRRQKRRHSTIGSGDWNCCLETDNWHIDRQRESNRPRFRWPCFPRHWLFHFVENLLSSCVTFDDLRTNLFHLYWTYKTNIDKSLHLISFDHDDLNVVQTMNEYSLYTDMMNNNAWTYPSDVCCYYSDHHHVSWHFHELKWEDNKMIEWDTFRVRT